jgi:hypothetical protein
MYVVAIAEINTGIDSEALALASELGKTPYEVRLTLAGGLPAVVLMTPDGERATRLMEGIYARRNGAIGADSSEVISSRVMTSMKRFRFEPDAIVLDDRPGLGRGSPDLGPAMNAARLPFEDVSALLRATHRQQIESREKRIELKFDMGRAVLSGGLAPVRNVERVTQSKLEEREQVLYLFRRSQEAPWILRETEAVYAGLGEALGATKFVNFQRTVQVLRGRIPTAAYDERLLSRRVPEHTKLSSAGETTTISSSSEDGVDLLAHLLAAWLGKSTAVPYR